jgi:hypothetical protein
MTRGASVDAGSPASAVSGFDMRSSLPEAVSRRAQRSAAGSHRLCDVPSGGARMISARGEVL